MCLWYYTILILCLSTIKPACGELDHGEVKLFDPTSYTVESTILLNDINKRDKEVSYKVNSTLNIYPTWKDDNTEYLLKFELRSPQLLSRGSHVRAEYKTLPSMWDSYSSTDFYAHWKNGLINEIYIDPSEPEEVLNFQRSLISMFQFKPSNDHSNETDISGTCEVLYENMSEEVIRKIKRSCSWGDDVSGEVTSRRVTRYSLDESRALEEAYAEEVHEQGGALGDAALKARAWLKLRRVTAYHPAPVAVSSTLQDALKNLPSALASLPLAMAAPTKLADSLPTLSELEALLEEAAEALGGTLQSAKTHGGAEAGGGASAEAGAEAGAEPGAGKGARGVAAATRLLSALRIAPDSALAELLRRAGGFGDGVDRRLELYYALGMAGSAGALGAAHERLHLLQPDEPALARRFLEGFAHAAAPDEAAVVEVLRIGEESASADVAESALLAAAAAAARLPQAGDVRSALLRALQRCQDDECRATRLRALGYLRSAELTDVLLRHAEHGASVPARAALDALAAVPELALYNATRLRRLERVVRGRGPLERRAAALHLLLQRSAPAPLGLLPMLGALRHEPAELRRLAWHGLEVLAAEHEAVRRLRAPMSMRLGSWNALAAPVASALLRLDAGGAGGWRAALRSELVSDGGELRRAELALSVTSPDGDVHDAVSVQLWPEERPLIAADADNNERGSGDEPRGTLALAVGGVRAGELPLFTKKVEPEVRSSSPVLHSMRALADAQAVLPLLGAGALQLSRRGAVALSLDVAVHTRASGRLELRGAVAVEAEALVRGAWGELRARSLVWAEPRMDVIATGACVRALIAPWQLGREVALRSVLGATRRRVERRRAARLPAPGRSLLLAEPATCAHLPLHV